MTLNRLTELYQAEQQGKQIMRYESVYGYFETTHFKPQEVTIGECELSDLLGGDESENRTIIFFIKDEEDKYGNKIRK